MNQINNILNCARTKSLKSLQSAKKYSVDVSDIFNSHF